MFSVLRSPFSVLRSPFSVLLVFFRITVRDLNLFLVVMGMFISQSPVLADSEFILTTDVDNAYPTAYCDIITFQIDITNTGSGSTFTGYVKIYPKEWDIVEVSDLPGNDIVLDPPFGATYVYFTTPSLETNQHVTYTYKLIAKKFYDFGYHTINRVTRTENDATQQINEYVFPLIVRPIPYPEREAYYASDLIYEFEHLNIPTLFPVNPQPGSNVYACNEDLSQRLYIADELIFDIPEYCLYYGDTLNPGYIIVESGGRIIIESGASLLIDSMTIRSCQEMWKGIYVKSGGVLTLKNCVIENAQYGIQAERGAILNVSETVFLNNYIGLYISPFYVQPDPENPQGSYVTLNGFYNNLFIGQGSMLPPYEGQSPAPGIKPYAGIEVNNVSSFILPGAVNSAFDGYANFFENLSNGLIARSTSLYVGDVFFKDIEYDPELLEKIQGYGIYVEYGKYAEIKGNTIGSFSGYSAHFDNVTTGIKCTSGNVVITGMTMQDVAYGIRIQHIKNRNINLADNDIQGSIKGIEVLHCVPKIGNIAYNFIDITGDGNISSCIEINDLPVPTRWNIMQNELILGDGKYGIIHRAGHEVAIRDNTITLNHITTEQKFGIYLDGSHKPQVTCNQLTGDMEGENYHNSWGIYTSSTPVFDVSCNDVENFRFGVNFAGMSVGSHLQGNTIGLQWDGLLLGRDPDDGNAIIGWQEHKGNIWSEDEEGYYHFAARHLGNAAMVGQSLFFIDTTDNPLFLPPTIQAAADWFYFESGLSFVCSSNNICPEEMGFALNEDLWDSLDLALVNGNLGFDYFDNPLSWTSRLHMYHRLHDESGQVFPSPIEDFLEDQSSFNIGKFSRAYDSLSSILRWTGPFEKDISDYPIFLNLKLDHVHILDSLLFIYPDNDSIMEVKASLTDSIALSGFEYNEADSLAWDTITHRLVRFLGDIESIEPDSIWEEQLQFTILESALLAKNDTLTSSTDLFELANICPDLYSDAVYHARSLIRADSITTFYDDSDLCTALYPRSVEAFTSEHGLRVFPNPASNNITIEHRENIVRVDILTLQGHPVMSRSFIPANRISFLLPDFVPGMYIVNCVTLSGRAVSAKVLLLNR